MSELSVNVGAPRPSGQAVGNRDKGVMVYMTDSQRTAFKRWAFDHEVSMSDCLASEVRRLVAQGQGGADLGPCAIDDLPGPETCVNGDDEVMAGAVENLDALVALASQRRRIDEELETRLWSALAGGARVPDLVSITGLTQEQIRKVLSHASAPGE